VSSNESGKAGSRRGVKRPTADGVGLAEESGKQKDARYSRLRSALSDIQALNARVAQLERDIQESRQLNKRLAEVTDVVAEVLLPAEHRDEARLRELLANYDRSF
jgi:hypothetical protein